MKRKISIVKLALPLAAIGLMIWLFSVLSHSAFQDTPLTDMQADSHGWGGYEIRTGPEEVESVTPRYIGEGFELSDKSYDAVRRSRVMAEEEYSIAETKLQLDYAGCGIELFLDGQLFYSDFQVSQRDSNGFLLLEEDDFAAVNDSRSIAVGLPFDYVGKTLTMSVYYPFADTWGVVVPPVVWSTNTMLAAGVGMSVTSTLWQVFWGVVMVLVAVGCAGSMGSASSRILRAKYVLLLFMYVVSFVLSAYKSFVGFYSGFTGWIDQLIPPGLVRVDFMGSVLLILCTLVLLVLALCERGQKRQTLSAGWTLLFGLIGFSITAMQNSTELFYGAWDYLGVLYQNIEMGNWMPVVATVSSTMMYTLTMQAIVQFISQQIEKWKTQSRIVERSRFARENHEIIMQVDEDSRKRKHEMKHH